MRLGPGPLHMTPIVSFYAVLAFTGQGERKFYVDHLALNDSILPGLQCKVTCQKVYS